MTNVADDERYQTLVASHIQYYGIHFAFDDESGSIPGGSGVLVRHGDIGGIVTCAHVLQLALERSAVRHPGSVSFVVGRPNESSLQNIHMQVSEFAKCPMAIVQGLTDTKQEQELGPDLGFVQLPELVMSSLAALGSILQMDKQAAAMRRAEAPTGTIETMTIVAGNLAELASTSVGSRAVLTMLTTAVFSVEPQPIEGTEGYDRFSLDLGARWKHPTSFGGLSGCGLWQLAIGRNGNDPIVLESRLAGIVYFETDADGQGYRRLIAHGPRSIYEKLVPRIEALRQR